MKTFVIFNESKGKYLGLNEETYEMGFSEAEVIYELEWV